MVLLYGYFFLFSFFAWGFTKSYTGDVTLNLVITGVPDEVVVIDSIPSQVTVPMEGKVFFHVYYKFFRPDVNINFLSKFQKANSELVISLDDIYASLNLNSLYRPTNMSKIQPGFPLVLTVVAHEGKKVPVTFGNSINLQFNPVTMSLVNWPVCRFGGGVCQERTAGNGGFGVARPIHCERFFRHIDDGEFETNPWGEIPNHKGATAP